MKRKDKIALKAVKRLAAAKRRQKRDAESRRFTFPKLSGDDMRVKVK